MHLALSPINQHGIRSVTTLASTLFYAPFIGGLKADCSGSCSLVLGAGHRRSAADIPVKAPAPPATVPAIIGLVSIRAAMAAFMVTLALDYVNERFVRRLAH